MLEINCTGTKCNKDGLEVIKRVVADYYRMPMETYKEHKASRKEDVIKIRQVFAYIARALFPKTPLKAIGNALGGFNHSTVSNSIKRIKNLIETEKTLASEISAIRQMIVNGYIRLDNIKALRLSPGSAVLFVGVEDSLINKIKKAFFPPTLSIKEFRQTGISIVEKRV